MKFPPPFHPSEVSLDKEDAVCQLLSSTEKRQNFQSLPGCSQFVQTSNKSPRTPPSPPHLTFGMMVIKVEGILHLDTLR